MGVWVEGAGGDLVHDALDAADEGVWRAFFEAGDFGEGVFGHGELAFHGWEWRFGGGEGVAEGFDAVVEDILGLVERVMIGLSEDEAFIGPAERHEFADEGDAEIAGAVLGIGWVGGAEPFTDAVDEVEVAVHFLVFDEGAAEDDLGDEDERDDVEGGFGVADETGDEEADADAAEGSEEHPEEIGEEHFADLEDAVADGEVDDVLGEGDGTEGEHFGEDVAGGVFGVVAFALEEDAVADDFVGAVGEAEEHGDDERHEEVGGDVECGGERVVAVFRPPEDGGDEPSEERGLEECGDHVGAVAEPAEDGAAHHDAEADPAFAVGDRVRGSGGGGGGWGSARALERAVVVVETSVFDVLDDEVSLEAVAPEVRREAACGGHVAAGVFFVESVAAEVAERGFEDIEDEFRLMEVWRREGGTGLFSGCGELFGPCVAEVGEHVFGVAEEDEFAAVVEEDGFLEELEETGAGLVDADEDDFVMGEAADDFEDVFGVFGGEA